MFPIFYILPLQDHVTNADLRDILCYCFGDFGTPPSTAGFPMMALLHTHFNKGAVACEKMFHSFIFHINECVVTCTHRANKKIESPSLGIVFLAKHTYRWRLSRGRSVRNCP